MRGEVHIGTSGWQYRHWCGPFYEERLSPARMLPFYLEHFDTVEVNNSFYRLPSKETFARWRQATPARFLFAVKASRFLTHMKKLKDPEQPVERLFSALEGLGPKLGAVLFQLPPGWGVNLERLEHFLSALPRGGRYALEFREPSWHQAPVYEILRRHNAAFCQFDLAGFQSPTEITADFAYVRLHGPGGAYQGSYNGAQLASWAKRIEGWRRRLRAVFLYFDNDQCGYAVRNALELKRLVREWA
jgi:uncharacterized protein YecE (DUF72 family)